jgi:hypothetical protein
MAGIICRVNKKGIFMQNLTLEQTAEYLEAAMIESTIDSGFSLAHVGISCAGEKFILVNDMFGCTVLTQSL